MDYSVGKTALTLAINSGSIGIWNAQVEKETLRKIVPGAPHVNRNVLQHMQAPLNGPCTPGHLCCQKRNGPLKHSYGPSFQWDNRPDIDSCDSRAVVQMLFTTPPPIDSHTVREIL